MNFYDSIIEAVEKYDLPATERGQLYTAAIEFLYFGREPDFKMSRAAGLCYEAMRPVFEKQRAKQRAGRKGGKQKAGAKQSAEQTPSKPQAERQADAKQTASEQEQEQEKGKEPPCGGSKRRLAPPTRDEVEAYAAEAGRPGFDAARFIDYYAAQGWRLSNGNPMRDWRAAVRNWARRDSPAKAEGVRDEYSAL